MTCAFMRLADTFIQKELHCIQSVLSVHTVYQTHGTKRIRQYILLNILKCNMHYSVTLYATYFLT